MSDRQRVARVSGFAAFALSALLALPHPAAAADPAPTFTKDVAPIFQAKCEACHRPDGMAPMSLVSYEEARPWAKSIGARVGGRQMPPWHIDKTVGIQKFKNDRSLDDDARAEGRARPAPRRGRPLMFDTQKITGRPDRFTYASVIDVLAIAVVIYLALLLVKGTTAMSLLRGFIIVRLGAATSSRRRSTSPSSAGCSATRSRRF